MSNPKNISREDLIDLLLDMSRNTVFRQEERTHKALDIACDYVHKHWSDLSPETRYAFTALIAEFINLLAKHEEWALADYEKKEVLSRLLH